VSATWETSFVAVSMLIGEPVDNVASALGGPGRKPATEWLRRLGEASREGRARALARVISELAVAIDAARLA
jgi:hypothetical protein